MTRPRALFLVLLLACTLPAAAASDPGVRRAWTGSESLTELSRYYGVSEEALRRANPELATGGTPAELSIPAPPKGWPRHQVVRGETLWAISKKYEVPLDELRQANGLTGDDLKSGQVLAIPRGAIPAAPPPNWLAVTLPDGRVGWVPGSAVLLPATSPGEPAQVLDLGSKLRGVPYKWGGEAPDGVDCSGFVQEVYRMAGHRLPRLADEQYAATKAVPRPDLQPGDLVFFTTYLPGPSHVGIYMGEGRFLHASSSRGVTDDSLDSDYFGPRFLGGRRLPDWMDDPSAVEVTRTPTAPELPLPSPPR